MKNSENIKPTSTSQNYFFQAFSTNKTVNLKDQMKSARWSFISISSIQIQFNAL